MIPCELLITKLLPAIRRQTVLLMLKRGKKQREIAKMLNLTEAAVSHYVARRRADGKDKQLNDMIGKQIKSYDDRLSFSENVCNICRNLRHSRELCAIHLKGPGSKPSKSDCSFCISACS